MGGVTLQSEFYKLFSQIEIARKSISSSPSSDPKELRCASDDYCDFSDLAEIKSHPLEAQLYGCLTVASDLIAEMERGLLYGEP